LAATMRVAGENFVVFCAKTTMDVPARKAIISNSFFIFGIIFLVRNRLFLFSFTLQYVGKGTNIF